MRLAGVVSCVFLCACGGAQSPGASGDNGAADAPQGFDDVSELYAEEGYHLRAMAFSGPKDGEVAELPSEPAPAPVPGELTAPKLAIDQIPKAVEALAPKYPPIARREGAEQTVTFRILVDKEGRVVEMNLIGKKDRYGFYKSAAEALRQWRYSVPTSEGQPVYLWMNQPIEFRLK